MDERVRDELVRRADEADVSSGARERVLRGVRPRRRWVRPVLAASLAVAATVALVAVVTRDAPLGSTGPAPSGGSSTRGDASGVGEWRDESWGGLTVSVPADWGWSAAPLGRNLLCDARPDAPGYVGRPVFLTDACQTYQPGRFPLGEKAPYVWLGTDLEPGSVELPAEGWVQETVVAEGVTLTVAAGDADLREQILASARPTELCAPSLPAPPEPDASFTREGTLGMAPDELVVCAYRETEGTISLVHAARPDDGAVAMHEAMLASDGGRGACSTEPRDREWVVLRVSGPDGYGAGRIFRQDVVHLAGTCPAVESRLGSSPLTPDLLRPWAVGGVPYVLYGPTGGKGATLDSFIPGWH